MFRLTTLSNVLQCPFKPLQVAVNLEVAIVPGELVQAVEVREVLLRVHL